MKNKKALIIWGLVGVLVIYFGINGFAGIAEVQEQIKSIKLKIIGEQIKLLQEKILGAGKEKPKPVVVESEPVKSKEELSKSLEEQIKQLEAVVRVLRPKAMDEEVLRLEKKITEISVAIGAAEGEKLVDLQKEFNKAVTDYNKLSLEVRKALDENIKAKQADAIREQIRALKEKISLLPTPESFKKVAAVKDESKKASLQLLQEQIKAVKAKLLAEQIKAVQEKIDQLKAK